jgi:hemerythrin-like domain-containing protein
MQGRETMSTDAIVMLKDDHKAIRREFRDYQRTRDTETAIRGEIADRIIELLTTHTYLENEVMYPRVRELVPTLEHDILESYEEHHVADLLVAEILALEPYEERFDAKMTVLIENVQHHMDEEEREWFPRVREALGRNTLQEIGRALVRAREEAPTRPTRPSAMAKAIKAVLE